MKKAKTVKQKKDVNELTLDMIDMGPDALYEPGSVSRRYSFAQACIV